MCSTAQSRLDDLLQRMDAIYPVTVTLVNGLTVTEFMRFEDCVYDVVKRLVDKHFPDRSWTTHELYNTAGDQIYKRVHVKCHTDDVLQLVDIPSRSSRKCPTIAYKGKGVRILFVSEGFRFTYTVNKYNAVWYNQRLLSVVIDGLPTNQVWIFDKRILDPSENLEALQDGDIVYILDDDLK